MKKPLITFVLAVGGIKLLEWLFDTQLESKQGWVYGSVVAAEYVLLLVILYTFFELAGLLLAASLKTVDAQLDRRLTQPLRAVLAATAPRWRSWLMTGALRRLALRVGITLAAGAHFGDRDRSFRDRDRSVRDRDRGSPLGWVARFAV